MSRSQDPADYIPILRDLYEREHANWAACLIPLCQPEIPHTHWKAGVEVPCEKKSMGKVPVAGRDWQLKAAECFEKNEDLYSPPLMADHVAEGGNIGWAVPRGLIVLDCDSQSASDWVCHELKGGIPRVPYAMSRPGRTHWVFRIPSGIEIESQGSANLPCGRIDIRLGGKGQIVVAPSTHAATGQEYRWIVDLPDSFEDVPEIPGELLKTLLDAQQRRDVTPGNGVASQPTRTHAGPPPGVTRMKLSDLDTRVTEGGRNQHLARVGGAIRQRVKTLAALDAELQLVNEEENSPPLEAAEVSALAASLMRYEVTPKRIADFTKAVYGAQPAAPGQPTPLAAIPTLLAPEPLSDDEVQAFLRSGEVAARILGPDGFTLDPPRRNWIVDGLIPEGCIGILYGATGVGKSILFKLVEVMLALGQPLGAFRVPRPVSVLDISLEDDGPEIERRLIHTLRANDLGAPSSAVGDLLRERLRVIDSVGDASQVVGSEELYVAALNAMPEPRLFAVDPATRLPLSEGDGNWYSDAGLLAEYLGRIAKQTGATCVAIYHENTGQGMLGGVANAIAARFVLRLEPVEIGCEKAAGWDLDPQREWFRLYVEKNSYGPKGGSVWFSRGDHGTFRVEHPARVRDLRPDDIWVDFEGAPHPLATHGEEFSTEELALRTTWMDRAQPRPEPGKRQKSGPRTRALALRILADWKQKGWVKETGKNGWVSTLPTGADLGADLGEVA